MRPMHTFLRVALALGLFTACGPTTEVTESTDEGLLCFQADGVLVVDFQTCLSGSCDTLSDATCSVTLAGATLTVESYLRIEHLTHAECDTSCGLTVAECQVPLTEELELDVVYGDTTVLWSEIPDCEML